jgi:hypothetical protein
LAGQAFGLDLKPSLTPSKPAPPPARPVTPAPVSTVPVAKPDAAKDAAKPTAKESEAAPVTLAKFANASAVQADFKGIQVIHAEFVTRGPRDFLEVKLAGAEGKTDAMSHVRLCDVEGKAIGYLKVYLHARGTSFDLKVMEADPARRRALMERTHSIQFQGVEKGEALLSGVCKRLP